VEAAITPRTAAVMPVHLFGQPADMPRIAAIAARHGLALIEDACQAHLATCAGAPVGSFGAAGAFSFYPTKNLGALGDGGAVVTRDGELAARLRRLRNGGQANRYQHVEAGVNSRLDEIQAAILRARLAVLPAATGRRRGLAARYRQALAGAPIDVPPCCDAGHVYHLFPVRVAGDRAGFLAHLEARGIGSLVHYPVPVSRQPMLSGIPVAECPVAERVCEEICSLPLYPQMRDSDVDLVASAVHAWRRATRLS
jgi:dTDP-3-amino-3,4,6-trideoxy-alpha-D-glucose transaminase